MIDLWERLRNYFDADDGSLPEVFIEKLSSQEVCNVYRWIRSQCDVYCAGGDPTLWDRVEQRDVPIKSIDSPAELVVAERAEPFRHGLTNLRISGVDLPHLTIAICPNTITFDYRMGSEWGATQLNAFFDLLFFIQKMVPGAIISHAFEGAADRSEGFTEAWSIFRREKQSA